MRIIILGSSGFIGSALVKHLASKPHNTIDGCDLRAGDANRHLNHFYQAANSQDLYNTIFQNSYDLCINCAGSASVSFSFDNPLYDYELNTLIVFRILSAIKTYNPECRFINMSSAAVYGNPVSLPISEDHPVSPISPYGNHKYMSELLCNQFYNFWGINTISLRVFSAYGPGLRKQLLWDIYKKITKGGVVSLFGTGNETRDFIYIDDLVAAIDLISSEKQWSRRVVNIANGTEVRIKDVLDAYIKKYPVPFQYEFTGSVKPGDPLNWRADISFLKSLGYSPQFGIEAGVEEYVKWILSF
jgi:UDP-glucose 4-epimerase